MKNCKQNEMQSILDHGISVRDHTFIYSNNYRLPDWFSKNSSFILTKLLSLDIIEQYTVYHDCGKPYCISYDENGNKHFYNHTEVSYNTWMNISDNMQVARLIKMDMDIHTIKDIHIDEFVKNDEAITLLIVGLAEIHANAAMFGGIESVSFKIKWNQLNKRGNAIFKRLLK
jgi:hypothetical protein